MQISATTGGFSGVRNQNVAVQPGDQITFGGWVNLQSGSSSSPGWALTVYNSSLAVIAYVATPTPSPLQWKYQSVSYTVPAGGAFVALYAKVYQPSGSTVIWVDDGFLSTGTFYYHADHLGSARMLSDTGGNAMWSATYLPFGQEWNPEPTPNHYKFTGKERDSESGLDNFGARYNSSQYGRFMSPDPLGGKLVDPQTLNKYSYTRNNPINLVDPTGLYTCRHDAGSSHCSSDSDWQFELARQQDLQSKNQDVVRAAQAYGDPNSSNGVTVGFAALGRGGEGGITTSYLGTDSNGNPQAHSDVTLNSSDLGKVGTNSVSTAFKADVGPEGSHVADAQDIFRSIVSDPRGNYTVGTIISQYSSEQRAYKVTDAIYRSANEPYNGCGNANCALGAGSSPIGLSQRIDQILFAHPDAYHSSDGRPLTPTNQGGNVLNLTVPH